MLVDVALSDILPEQCNTLHTAMKSTRERFEKDLTERKNRACEDLARQEASLRRALRDAVVEDVMKRFPCAFLRLTLKLGVLR